MTRDIDLRNKKSQRPDREPVLLTVLGTRGSMPVSGEKFAGFGSATSCYLYEAGNEAIILDAGNGILNLPDTGDRRVSLIITHSHLDHILGLPSFLGTMGGRELTVYGATHEGKTMRQQLDELLSRPLWPIGIDVYGVKIRFVEIEESASGAFKIGDVTVSAMASNHPGESTVIGLEYNGRKLVYASDFEHTAGRQKRTEADETSKAEGTAADENGSSQILAGLASFSKGADLLLYDGQYAPPEYESHRGFGHSTYEQGIKVKEMAGALFMRIVHHDPGHSDDFLNEMERKITGLSQESGLAREGDRYIF